MTSHRTPRSIGLGVAAILIASSFLGCPLLKKKAQPADAGDDDDDVAAVVDAATVTASEVGAKNEANVLRYANETPLSNEPAVIGTKGAKARNFPGNGPEVANLAAGTNVTKVAQYFNTATLIMFDDPSGDGSKLLGWVSPKAFDVSAPAPTATTTSTTPTPTPTPTKDATPARVVDAGSSAPKDAGVTIQDAGSSTAAKDAGVAPKPVADAGGGGGGSSTIPQPPRGALAVPPTNGKCPDGWAVAESMCRRKCTADSECPRGTKCATKQGVKVCTSDH